MQQLLDVCEAVALSTAHFASFALPQDQDRHYLYLQTQFGADRCTQFRVIVVTDPQTQHKPTDRTDYTTLRRSSQRSQTHRLHRVLMRPQQQLHDARYRAVLAQRRVIGRTQRQVADETDDGLDEWPLAGRVQQLHERRQAVVMAHRVLRRAGLRVTTRQVT